MRDHKSSAQCAPAVQMAWAAPRHRRQEVRSKAMPAMYRAASAPSSVRGWRDWRIPGGKWRFLAVIGGSRAFGGRVPGGWRARDWRAWAAFGGQMARVKLFILLILRNIKSNCHRPGRFALVPAGPRIDEFANKLHIATILDRFQAARKRATTGVPAGSFATSTAEDPAPAIFRT